MAAPAVIDVQRQKDAGDCVLSCVSMILGQPYQDVCRVASELFDGRPWHEGLGTRDTQRLVRHLRGSPFQSLRVNQNTDLVEETGVLFVHLYRVGEHAVVLFEGSVYDPWDGMMWNLHAYLATKKGRILRFLRP